jgi:hypothetical protein
MEMEEMIKYNAELVVKQMREISNVDFGYNAESVAWLEGYIERQRNRDDIEQETIQKLVSVLGSYLGECIIKCYGGKWENEDGQWRVWLGDKGAAYPFNKVEKQFENGIEDSIKGFFQTIPILFAIPAMSGETSNKPWWKLW